MSVALVIGGTSGLGRALAVRMFQDGVVPIIVGRRARTVVAEDPELRGAHFLPCDLTDPEAAEQIIGNLGNVLRVREAIHEVDYLVLAGGQYLQGDVRWQTSANVNLLWRTNVTALLEIVQTFMRAKRHGGPFQLITISSTTAKKVRQNQTVYAMTQAARATMGKNLLDEMLRHDMGCRSMVVYPPGMKSGMWRNFPDVDTSQFLEPSVVANIIWEKALVQLARGLEITIERTQDGNPFISEGIFLNG